MSDINELTLILDTKTKVVHKFIPTDTIWEILVDTKAYRSYRDYQSSAMHGLRNPCTFSTQCSIQTYQDEIIFNLDDVLAKRFIKINDSVCASILFK